MVNDDFDRQEVDRLVRELNSRKPPVVPPPAVYQPAPPPPPAPEPVPRVVSRWTSARFLMPAMTASRPRHRFASAFALPALPGFRLPALPAFTLPTLTGERWSVLIVRGWVTLGILLSISMAYWPYPKTYLVGMLLYLFAVAIVVVAGVWSAKLTWDLHLGGAHTISIGIVLWAIVLVAETVPPLSGGS